MTVAGIVLVLHVIAVFWLISGVLGRDVVSMHARGVKDLRDLRALVEVGHRFEMRMVRPGSFAVLVTGVLAAWMRGWPILGSLQGGHTNWVLVSLLIFLSLIPLIVFVFLPRGKVFRAALDAAVGRGAMTAELTAALSDPAVRAARVYEMIATTVITVLMVTRPF